MPDLSENGRRGQINQEGCPAVLGLRDMVSLTQKALKVVREKEPFMFAVIKTGGKQYKVAANDVITIERLEAEAGDMLTRVRSSAPAARITCFLVQPLVKGLA